MSPKSSLWTIVSVAIVAYAAVDMTHEVLGHGVACALNPGVRALSLSTVGLQTDVSSRAVAAAGSIANVVVGLLTMLWFRRRRGFGASSYFAWLFASLNLLNGTGYLLFSGVLDFGDWAVVIAGREPHLAWRVLLAVAGIILYVWAIRLSAAALGERVQRGEVDREELPRLVFPAYLAGGLLFVAGAAFNPVGPELILLSGASSGFGAMAGLTLVPRMAGKGPEGGAAAPPLRHSPAWIGVGGVVLVLFVFVLGRGVKL